MQYQQITSGERYAIVALRRQGHSLRAIARNLHRAPSTLWRASGHLWRHMRQASKQRRKRYGAYDSRGRLAGKRHISERPIEAEGRRELGHWEIDPGEGRRSGQAQRRDDGRARHAAAELLPWAYIVVSNFKRWQLDVFHGVSAAHLQSYLDEFRYRLNRRETRLDLFRRILNRCVLYTPPTTYSQLIAA